MRRFPPTWTVEKIPGGFKVVDANGQSLAYVYSRDSHSQQQRQDAMQQVYVSDKGDDKNDGLSLEAPIKSLKRLWVLWGGRELVLMEGRETFNRLVDEMVVFVRFAKGASKNENRASEAPKLDTSSP